MALIATRTKVVQGADGTTTIENGNPIIIHGIYLASSTVDYTSIPFLYADDNSTAFILQHDNNEGTTAIEVKFLMERGLVVDMDNTVPLSTNLLDVTILYELT